MRNRELTGRFLGEQFVFGEGERRCVVGGVMIGKDKHTVRGYSPDGELQAGMTYRFYGHTKTHPKYGDQFQFNSFTIEKPADDESLVAYLLQCRGPQKGSITERVAWALVETFGGECIDVVLNRPAEAAAGIGRAGTRWDAEKALLASQHLRLFENSRAAKVELLGLLDGRGFPKKTPDRCLKKWGTAAPRVIAEDAFCLTALPGIGFKGADKMFCDLARKNSATTEEYQQALAAIKRQALCAAYAVKSDRSGSTWVSRRTAELAIRQNVANTLAKPDEAIRWAVAKGYLAERTHGGDWLAVATRAEHETEVAAAVNDLLSRDDIAWPTELRSLSEHQSAEVAKALRRRVGVLRGSPGCGKTYTMAYLVEWLIDNYGSDSVAIACPTGKAAVRATQAMVTAGVSVVATTIHRMLVVEKGEDGDWSFFHNDSNPLPYRFIVADECFPRGTLIDTPDGRIAIEKFRPGDEIENAQGRDIVLAICRKEVDCAVKITAGETEIVCSENHPVFTSRGIVLAGELESGDSIVQTAEAVRLLREYALSKQVESRRCSLLLTALLDEMVDAVPGAQSEDVHQRESDQSRRRQGQVSQVKSSRCHRSSRSNSETKSDEKSSVATAVFREAQEHRAQAANSRRERTRANESRITATRGAQFQYGLELVSELHCEDGERLSPDPLQTRYCKSGDEDCSRSGWCDSQHNQGQSSGRTEDQVFGSARVDCVEVLESGDIRLDQFRDADGKLYFYDLQAARHRSYSVNGLLVHNCSMIDTDLMASLLRACSEDVHLLLTGDAEQLAPVGHGRPFLDLQEIVPTGSLTEIRRNSGRIVQACAEIRDTKRFTPSKTYNEAAGENLPWIECKEDDLQDTVLGLVQQIERGGECNPIWDVQILTACNLGTPVSRKVLNPKVQDMLNPNGAKCVGNPFRVGDKIVCLKNGGYWLTPGFMAMLSGYDSEMVGEDQLFKLPDGQTLLVGGDNNEVYVANGELAEVLEIEPAKMLVKLFDPPREVTVPYQPVREDERGIEDDSENESKGAVGDWDLGYVLSNHKSQGSQWQYVVWICDPSSRARNVQTRNLVYTGISRASRATFCVGEIAVAQAACRRDGLAGRKTFLVEQIRWDKAAKGGLLAKLREPV